MIYGYARVSDDNQNLEKQLVILKKNGCQKIYTDKFISSKMKRKEFEKILKKLKANDTIVITKLDRFVLTAEQGLKVVQELFKRDVKVHIVNMGIIEKTLTGRLILKQLSAFAEFERATFIERTKEGKEIAKLKPKYRESNPKKITKDQIITIFTLLEEGLSVTEIAKKTKISESTIYREKRLRRNSKD